MSSNPSPLLSCQKLCSGYSGVAVVKDVSFEISSGLVGIVGRNGVGKTTLLKTLAGLMPPMSGKSTFVNITGDAVNRSLGGMAYMPQELVVYSSLSVKENLLLAVGNDDSLSTAKPYLEAFPRLAERMEVRAGSLSGGEKKMLSFVRTMIEPDKSLLLLDEPTEGVQHTNAQKMAGFIATAKDSKAFLVVEQNLEFLETCADHFMVMDRGMIVMERSRDEFDMKEMEDAISL